MDFSGTGVPNSLRLTLHVFNCHGFSSARGQKPGSQLCLFSLPGVLAQGQLQQSGPGAVKSGEPLTLTCTLSGNSQSNAGSSWNWIRRPAGRVLEWMGNIWRSAGGWPTNYAWALQSRLTISQEASKSQFSLQLLALTAVDTAACDCARGIHTRTSRRRVAKWSRG